MAIQGRALPLCHVPQLQSPKFKDVRKVAHNDAWEAVAAVLQQLMGPKSTWQFQWGTAVSSGPCCTLLRPVIQHLPAPAPPKRWTIEELAQLKPDSLAVNTAQCSIVILKFSRPLAGSSGPPSTERTSSTKSWWRPCSFMTGQYLWLPWWWASGGWFSWRGQSGHHSPRPPGIGRSPTCRGNGTSLC